MRFEELVADVRERRQWLGRIRRRAGGDLSREDHAALQVQYDDLLVTLARVLRVEFPVGLPTSWPRGTVLYADHRLVLEDRIIAAGANVRAS